MLIIITSFTFLFRVSYPHETYLRRINSSRSTRPRPTSVRVYAACVQYPPFVLSKPLAENPRRYTEIEARPVRGAVNEI